MSTRPSVYAESGCRDHSPNDAKELVRVGSWGARSQRIDTENSIVAVCRLGRNSEQAAIANESFDDGRAMTTVITQMPEWIDALVDLLREAGYAKPGERRLFEPRSCSGAQAAAVP